MCVDKPEVEGSGEGTAERSNLGKTQMDETRNFAHSHMEGICENTVSTYSMQSQLMNFVPKIRSGECSDIGRRDYMEDTHVCISNLAEKFGNQSLGEEVVSFFGVFDGHGGKGAANFVRDNLPRLIVEDADFPLKLEKVVTRSFMQTDARFAEKCALESTLSSGTTALTAMIFGRTLLVANAGDCRAVLSRLGLAIEMSTDHRPSCIKERKRIESLGGYVDDDYLNGQLGVTRALGDWHIEGMKGFGDPSGPLSAEPELKMITLTKDDEFLIIGSDGIWDVFTNQNAVDFVRRRLQEHNDVKICCKELIEQAKLRGAMDNLTIVMVCFQLEPPTQITVSNRPKVRSSETLIFAETSIFPPNMAANTMARSFLQAVASEEVTSPLRVVQMEGLAILKIIKHCKEFSPALVTGQLLGLDVGSVLEVTNCFPFPVKEEDDELEADGANYQLEMMRCLREVNVDNNTVGWYQSTLLGSYQTAELIETFLNYQENIRRCVCIIYDPARSSQGVLALKALKLSDSFMELYRKDNFTGEKLREKKLSWVDIFEEIPIKVSNSALISAFMTELEPDTPVAQCDYDRLNLSTSPFMERNVEFLIECMDDLNIEQNKFQYYYRNLQRQQTQQLAWLQKRRAENMARKAAGEEPLPEEDPLNPIFKPLPEPTRLETYLITNQVANYCNQINGVAGQSFSKLYLMKALQDN